MDILYILGKTSLLNTDVLDKLFMSYSLFFTKLYNTTQLNYSYARKSCKKKKKWSCVIQKISSKLCSNRHNKYLWHLSTCRLNPNVLNIAFLKKVNKPYLFVLPRTEKCIKISLLLYNEWRTIYSCIDYLQFSIVFV